MAEQGTGIEVRTKYFPLAFLLSMTKPVVEIDGSPHKTTWGSHFYPASPGRHTVTVYFSYLGRKQTGKNSIDVDVPQGGSNKVTYNMPPWMFARGRMKLG